MIDDNKFPQSFHNDLTKIRITNLTFYLYAITVNRKPSASLESNYCRNPDNWEKPWCYVTKSGLNSDGNYWEFCDIPKCSAGGKT